MSCLLPHFNCPPPPIIHTHRHHLILLSAAAAASASATKTRRHFRPQCILSPSTPKVAWPCVAAAQQRNSLPLPLLHHSWSLDYFSFPHRLCLFLLPRHVHLLSLHQINMEVLADPEPQTDDELDDPKPDTSDEQLIKLLMKMDLEKVMDSLNPRQKQVIRWRFGMDDGRMKTLQEIGEVMGVHRYNVREIEARAFKKLKSEMRIEHLQHSVWLHNLAVKLRIFKDLIKLEKPQEDLMEGLSDVLLTPKALESLETEIGINQSLEPLEVLADPEPQTDDELDDPKPDTSDEQLIKLLMKMDLEKVMDSLNPRQKQVIRWRFGMDDGRMKSLQEIGKMMGVSRERIRQIEVCAFKKLKSEMMRDEHLQLQHSMWSHNLAVKLRICCNGRLFYWGFFP
ncbi:RNA polymerase sigma factor SigA4-like isoform X2 [Trifolium pratense]|uniref:RNA polymerase sigma factor SigA4-like isoform X2 n=1 Tax=Trifolium pratense TaxID=57577 RepID=UPI001E69119C|nr:RNA polymerase sigma factor SigA4-like isoform X2 [Trifolium pratense]